MNRPFARAAGLVAVAVVPLAFAGLLAGAAHPADAGTSRIPAAIVNSDELVETTAPDGTETPVFAGRQLVTELTGDDDSGFDWTITNADDAADALAAGDVYAVLTVPEGFSESVLSLQSDDPRQAELSIRTDDAHGYVTAPLADAVGESMAAAFGRQVTEQYLTGVSASIGGLGDSLGAAADGAEGLATGATDLGSGIGALAEGAGSARSGAGELVDGVREYTGGVRSLSDGLAQLDEGAAGLDAVSDGVSGYTGGVSRLAEGLAAASAQLSPLDPAAGAVQQLSAQLSAVAAQGGALDAQTRPAVDAVQSGVSQSASGARRLDRGSGALVDGAGSLASGLGELETGASNAASGARQLAGGAGELAAGLRSGAEQVPPADADAAAETSRVVAEPVRVETDRDNAVSDLGRITSTLFVPLGLWLGALATFLALRPVTRRALGSAAPTRRIVVRSLARAAGVAAAQAVLLVAMLHLALGVAWTSLPVTLGFGLLMALAFTAFHQLLVVGFGRAGLVVSLLLLALQITSTGGLYPVEVLAAPFRAVSPFLPLTQGVRGMQAILTGTDPGAVAAASLALLGFGVASGLLVGVVTGRMRRARALGLVPATA